MPNMLRPLKKVHTSILLTLFVVFAIIVAMLSTCQTLLTITQVLLVRKARMVNS